MDYSQAILAKKIIIWQALTLSLLSVHPLLLLARFTTFESARSMRWLGCRKYPPIPPFPRMRVCGTPRPRIKEMPFLADRAAVGCQRDGAFRSTLCALFLFLFHSLARLVSAPKQRLF